VLKGACELGGGGKNCSTNIDFQIGVGSEREEGWWTDRPGKKEKNISLNWHYGKGPASTLDSKSFVRAWKKIPGIGVGEKEKGGSSSDWTVKSTALPRFIFPGGNKDRMGTDVVGR